MKFDKCKDGSYNLEMKNKDVSISIPSGTYPNYIKCLCKGIIAEKTEDGDIELLCKSCKRYWIIKSVNDKLIVSESSRIYVRGN